jgi:hypothetical protein
VCIEALPTILDYQCGYGYTALHWCASYGSEAVAATLIEKGCDTSIINDRGKTAWDLAEQVGAQGVMALLSAAASEPQISQCYDLDNGVSCTVSLSMCYYYRHSHHQLRVEATRRKQRPEVRDIFRDDIQLEFARFTLWRIDLSTQPQNWLQIAQGGFGTVYKVTDVSPPITISGIYYRTAAIKIPNHADAVEELKAEVESLSVLAHGAL